MITNVKFWINGKRKYNLFWFRWSYEKDNILLKMNIKDE